MDLASCLRHAVTLHGKERAVVCGTDVAWDYATLAARARALASGAAELGSGPGSTVAILHRNCHRFLLAALGTAEAGIGLVPLNFRLDARTLATTIADAGARLLLTEEPLGALAAACAAASGARVELVDDVVARGDGLAPTARPLPQDLAQLYYTSGTTGEPRGVVLTQQNVASHALMTIAELGLSDREAWGHVAPMFHLADAWSVFAVTWAGGLHVMVPQFEPAPVLDAFARHGVTMTNLVPTMLGRILDHPDAGRGYPALRRVLSGGAPIAPAVVERVVATFRTEYVQTYGLTETSPYLTFSTLKRSLLELPSSERLRYAARTGRPALGVELTVADERGFPVPADDASIGEIQVRAPWVTPGYHRRPEATAAAFRDGWFLTGDLATWDREGYVNIVDRKKDMIISGGEKVFSVEVEAALLAHGAIRECAVVGLRDPDWGEAVCAALVSRDDRRPGDDELRAFLRERVAGFKVPKRFVWLDDLPKTGSGKIRKVAIRESLQ